MNNELRQKALQSAKALCNAKKIVRGFGPYHDQYSFYTTLKRVKQLIREKQLWLTRLDTPDFDDTIEQKKYGDEAEQRRTFVRCFSFGIQESAAMWGLYCPPTYQAIRVSFRRDSVKALLKGNLYLVRDHSRTDEEAAVASKFVSDILYASVNGDGDTRNRANTLYWNGFYVKTKKDDLERSRKKPSIAGFVKDSEWKFENESRLFVKTRSGCDVEHLCLDVPEEVFPGLSFTLSPWIEEDEESFVKHIIVSWLENCGSEVSKNASSMIASSVLKDGLGLWKKKRGL